MKYIAHFGYDGAADVAIVRRYADDLGYEYKWTPYDTDMFKAATLLKNASLAVIWNGLQAGASLATRLCRRRSIPTCYMEWGLLPQRATFCVDPSGFCADSILARDVSWVTDEDMDYLYQVRAELQERYPLDSEGHVLAILQIENDTQVLYFSPYRNMEEFIAHIEAMYPTGRIIARPHPKSPTRRQFERADVAPGGDYLEEAARAGVVVGITSTCLYEAAILGVPVVALGDHPLRLQPKHLHERVLAGALALRMDRQSGDLAVVLERFGIRPL
jgi:capsule polysaccharide export protein KpsC/LpsZ